MLNIHWLLLVDIFHRFRFTQYFFGHLLTFQCFIFEPLVLCSNDYLVYANLICHTLDQEFGPLYFHVVKHLLIPPKYGYNRIFFNTDHNALIFQALNTARPQLDVVF